jgi:hypothetical protein
MPPNAFGYEPVLSDLLPAKVKRGRATLDRVTESGVGALEGGLAGAGDRRLAPCSGGTSIRQT